MKRLFVLLVLVSLTLGAVGSAFAQSSLHLSAVEIDLWPEYDRSGVLVIYRIGLPADATLPMDVNFRIPISAGAPTAVAVRQTSGGLFTVPFEQRTEGAWLVLSFTATFPEVQIEYYDQLTIQSDARHFTYTWAGDYAVDSLTLQVQQPMGASGMVISPSLGNGVKQSDGLTYFMSQVGQLDAGQTFELQIDYQKSDNALSAESLQLQPSAPVVPPPSLWEQIQQNLPWILGGLGVFLLLIGGIWYWQSNRQPAQTTKRSRKPARSKKQIEGTESSDEEMRYCPQCGKRAHSNDKFCRTCGSPLR